MLLAKHKCQNDTNPKSPKNKKRPLSIKFSGLTKRRAEGEGLEPYPSPYTTGTRTVNVDPLPISL